MAYIGYEPAKVPLTSADITDNIIVNADINSSAAIAKSKLNLTGTIAIADLSATGTPSSTTFLRGDNTWGSAGATAGQVIQVVTATDQTQRSTTSQSFVTGSNTLSASITPSSASNKILVLLSTDAYGSTASCFVTIYRGATNLGNGNNGMMTGGIDFNWNASCMIYDSPATTSSTTYQAYFRHSSASGISFLVAGSGKSSITLLEIKG